MDGREREREGGDGLEEREIWSMKLETDALSV